MSDRARQLFRFIAVLTLLLMVALPLSMSPATAHEIRPTIVNAAFGEGEALELSLSTNAEALLAGIGPQHDDTDEAPEAERYNALRALDPAALEADIRAFAPRLIEGIALEIGGEPVALSLTDISVPAVGDTEQARQTLIRLTGQAAAEGVLIWRFAPDFGASVVRVSRPGQDDPFDSTFILAGDTASIALGPDAPPRSAMQTLYEYIYVGFDHIIPKGLDHILFVIGLFLLNSRLGPLLWQVTTFTLAHSVTLALAALGIVTVAPSIVEPLIAASIVFIALENILTDKLNRWRLVMVFVFGLLHGLGFAGVLSEFGLPPGQFVSGLIGFNIGVEIGQLTVIALCYLLVGLWFSGKSWYRPVIVYPASIAIALIAAYWFVERVGLLG